MSKVSYNVGATLYSFDSLLQLEDISFLAVEQNLIEEIKDDMQRRKLQNYGAIREITIVDDNGITAVAKDFSETGTLRKLKI